VRLSLFYSVMQGRTQERFQNFGWNNVWRAPLGGEERPARKMIRIHLRTFPPLIRSVIYMDKFFISPALTRTLLALEFSLRGKLLVFQVLLRVFLVVLNHITLSLSSRRLFSWSSELEINCHGCAFPGNPLRIHVHVSKTYPAFPGVRLGLPAAGNSVIKIPARNMPA